MAGPEVGEIYLQTHADTKGLAAEIRRAADQEGTEFGRAFSDAVDSSMGDLSNIIRHNMNADSVGKMTGQEFANSIRDGFASQNLNFDRELAAAIGDDSNTQLRQLLEGFDDLGDGADRVRARLEELSSQPGFDRIGTSLEALTTQVDDTEESIRVLREEQAAAAAEGDRQVAAYNRQQQAMRAMREEISFGIDQSEKLAKANERIASKKQAQALRDQQAAMKAVNDEISFGIRRSEDLAKANEKMARSANLTESTRQANAYSDAVADTASQLRAMQTQLNKMGNAKQFEGQSKAISDLAAQVREASDQFTVLQRASRDSTVGLDKGLSDFGRTMQTNTVRVREFANSLQGIEARIQVEADYPATTEARVRGALLGSTFGKAFNDATESSSAGAGAGMFDSLTREWNQFLYAFPAEVTILLRYFALIGSEVSTLGSTIGASLTAAVSSLGIAIGGLASAGVGVFAGFAGQIALARAALENMETAFPPTYQALQQLEDGFAQVQVSAFAAEWEGSLRSFAGTLDEVVRASNFGEAFGQSAAQITNAFGEVVSSGPFSEFVSAMESQIPTAMTNIGQGAASLTSALLPVLTAAAPLAQGLAEQFSAWAAGLARSANSADGLAAINGFMSQASVAIDQLVRLVGNLAAGLGNVFSIGAESGNRMLSTLADLAEQFRAFTESAAGQSSIALWFSQGEQVMSAMLPLLGALGQMFASLVTPQTVAQLVGVINGLTQLAPVIGQVLGALAQLNFLGLVVQTLNAIGQAIAPVIPLVADLASLISSTLGQALTALQPALNALGQAFASVLGAVLPVIGEMLTALQPAFTAIGEAVGALAPALVSLFVAFNPVLRVVLLLLPALQPLIPVIVQIVEFISQLAVQFADVINPIVQTVAAFLGFSKATAPLAGGLDKLGAGFGNLGKAAGGFVEGIAKSMPQIVGTIAGVVQNVAGAIAKVLPQIATAISGVLPVLATTLTQILPQITTAITTAVPVLLQAAINLFMTLVQAVTTVLPQVLQAILTALPQLIQAIVSMIPILLQAAMQLFQSLVTALVTIVPQLLNTLLTLLPQLLNTIVSMIPMLLQTALQLFMTIVQALLQAIPQILTALLGMLPPLLQTIIGMIPQLLQAGIQLFVSLVTAIVTALPQILSTLLGILPQLLSTIIGMIPQLLQAGIQLFVSLVTSIVKALPDILSALFGILPQLLSTIIGMIPQLISAGIDLFISLVDAIVRALPQILSALFGILPDLISTLVRMIPQLISAAVDLFLALVQGIAQATPQILAELSALGADMLSELGSIDLWQIGSDIMNSLWEGLQSAWSSVSGWLSGIGDSIREVKGPPSKDRVLLYDIGQMIMGGLQNGMVSQIPGLMGTLRGVSSMIRNTPFSATLRAGMAFDRRSVAADLLGAGVGPGGRQVIVQPGAIQVTPVQADPVLTASAVLDRLAIAIN